MPMMTPGTLRCAGAVAVVVLASSGQVAEGTAKPVMCDALDLSPAFAKDGTALCVARHVERPDLGATGVDVHLTTDGGRTWRKRAANGLAFRPDSRWRQVVFSARYADDRAIYVQEAVDGLYRTTDNGATFTLVDPLATGGGSSVSPQLAAVVAELPSGLPPPLPRQSAAALAYASGLPALIAPPVHQPVAGSPGGVSQWLLAPGFPSAPGFALVDEYATGSAGAGFRTKAYACDGTFACPVEAARFPDGLPRAFSEVVSVKGKAHIAVGFQSQIDQPGAAKQVWHSPDGGRTWSRWVSVEALVRQIGYGDYNGHLSGGPNGIIYLRLDHTGAENKAVPAVQLYRSSDNGEKWVRIAYGRSVFQSGASGTLPLRNDRAARFNQSRIWVAATGEMFMLGATRPWYASAVFCSRDGIRWSYTCAR